MNDLRGSRPSAGFAQQPVSPVQTSEKRVAQSKSNSKMMNVWFMVMLLSVTLVLAGLMAFLIVDKDNKVISEANVINKDGYQAVFIGNEDPQNLSRTYFGHLRQLDDKTYVLSDVFVALEGTTGEGDNAVKTAVLDKIGCGPIQGPVDTIYINRSSVAFWTNLQEDSKLTRSIAQYKEKFTKPIECDENGTNKNAPADTTAPTQQQQ